MEPNETLGVAREDEKDAGREAILNQLEHGEIDVNEAIRQLEHPVSEPAEAAPSRGIWRLWWAIFLGSGAGLAVMAAGLGTLGGWWWLAAAPAAIIALLLIGLAVISLDAPFVLVSIETGSTSWPENIRFGLPLPLNLIARLLRAWPGRKARLRGTALDELILSLDAALAADHPIVIGVHEGRGGERVRVYIG